MSAAAVAVISAMAVAVTYNLNNSDDSIVINVSKKSIETFSDESAEESDESSDEIKSEETRSKQTTKKKTSKTKTRTSSRKSSNKSLAAENSSVEISFPIELNYATAEELCQIDGVGETLAASIIAYRDSIGGYTNRVQLLEVNGIGEVKYAAIKEYLYIENEQDIESEQDTESWQEVTDSVTETQMSETAEEESVSETIDEADIDYDIYDSDEEDMDFTEDDILIGNFIYVELNSAELDDLKEIPCFDEEMCLKILELRDEIGGFSNTYELFYIDGMTKTLFCEAEKYIYVESEDIG